MAYRTVVVPDIERPPEAVRDHIAQWYEDHQFTYAKVWERLDEVRAHWGRVDFDGKVALLKLSYINSVFSIQTAVHLHEEAFQRCIYGGEGFVEALRNSGAGLENNKGPAMYETLADDSLWDEATELLIDGNVDTAHKLLIDNAKWLGTAKSPFTLANLGFTQKMCVDSNVANLMRADEPPDTVDVAKYESLCADIQDMFPELSGDPYNLDPYHLQWLIFDYQRFFRSGKGRATAPRPRDKSKVIARHDIWFDTALSDISFIKSRMRELTARGKVETRSDAEIDRAISELARRERQQLQQEVEGDIEAAIRRAEEAAAEGD